MGNESLVMQETGLGVSALTLAESRHGSTTCALGSRGFHSQSLAHSLKTGTGSKVSTIATGATIACMVFHGQLYPTKQIVKGTLPNNNGNRVLLGHHARQLGEHVRSA